MNIATPIVSSPLALQRAHEAALYEAAMQQAWEWFDTPEWYSQGWHPDDFDMWVDRFVNNPAYDYDLPELGE
jgi:hypothetical protein